MADKDNASSKDSQSNNESNTNNNNTVQIILAGENSTTSSEKRTKSGKSLSRSESQENANDIPLKSLSGSKSTENLTDDEDGPAPNVGHAPPLMRARAPTVSERDMALIKQAHDILSNRSKVAAAENDIYSLVGNLTKFAEEQDHEHKDHPKETEKTKLKKLQAKLQTILKEHPGLLDKKGGAGETALHFSLLGNTKASNRVARAIIREKPELVHIPYDSSDYGGEVPVHMAIVNRDLDMLKFLVKYKADVVHPVVEGLFFKPKKDGGTLYYGQTPLHFAVCVGALDIVEFLIGSCGVPVDQVDSRKNTPLHFAVITSNFEIYKWLLNHGANKDLKNKQDVTPLNYAAKRGNLEMYNQIIEAQRDILWSYGPITCAMYPIDELNATLENIVTKTRLKMMKNPVVLQFLKDKWVSYARVRFWRAFLFEIIYLLLLMVSIGLRPEDSEDNNLYTSPTKRTIARYVLEVIIVLGSLWLLSRHARSIRKLSFDVWINASGALPTTMAWGHCVFILVAFIMRLVQAHIVEDILVAFACVFGWIHLLSYHRAIKLTGSFVVMIYKMLLFDIVRFAAIYIVLLAGFAQAFYVLFRRAGAESDNLEYLESEERSYRSLGWSMMSTFFISFGDLGYDSFESLTTHDKVRAGFAHLFFIVYIVLVTILMLNLLIAMMGTTFSRVMANAELEWRHQWARLILLLENDMRESEKANLRPKNQIEVKEGQWWMIMQQRADQEIQKGDDAEDAANPQSAGGLLALLWKTEDLN